MDYFDELVDDLIRGEGLIQEFEDGVTISAHGLDKIGITIDSPGHMIDIVLSGEQVDYLHLFLQAQFAAAAAGKDINWDELLDGNP